MKLTSKIGRICGDLAKLDLGPLAELRRMETATDAYGAPYFWRLCARYDLAQSKPYEPAWAQVIQALAILTPKGRDDSKTSRHAVPERMADTASGSNGTTIAQLREQRRGLGHVLCDGADRAWPEDRANPRPVYSEGRLAQLLGSTGETRVDLVRRAARLLAARLPPDASFDCTDLACLLLYPDDPENGRRIARDYYARLDGASRANGADNAEPDTGDDA